MVIDGVGAGVPCGRERCWTLKTDGARLKEAAPSSPFRPTPPPLFNVKNLYFHLKQQQSAGPLDDPRFPCSTQRGAISVLTAYCPYSILPFLSLSKIPRLRRPSAIPKWRGPSLLAADSTRQSLAIKPGGTLNPLMFNGGVRGAGKWRRHTDQ